MAARPATPQLIGEVRAIVAGAVAVGIGRWLIGDADPAGVTARARQVAAQAAAEVAGRAGRA